jgi:hypothetical protein
MARGFVLESDVHRNPGAGEGPERRGSRRGGSEEMSLLATAVVSAGSSFSR